MARQDHWLDSVKSWLALHQPDLENEGIVGTLTERTRGRAKNSVAVSLETETNLVEAIVWDSGETEIVAAGKQDSIPSVRTMQLADPADVAAFLDQAREALNEE